ncbi:unnamed protein product, partial [Scytosiphon promiscuus]
QANGARDWGGSTSSGWHTVGLDFKCNKESCGSCREGVDYRRKAARKIRCASRKSESCKSPGVCFFSDSGGQRFVVVSTRSMVSIARTAYARLAWVVEVRSSRHKTGLDKPEFVGSPLHRFMYFFLFR